MPARIGPGRAALLGGGGGPVYLLHDQFTTDLAAGSVNGTLAEPGGTGTVAQRTRTVTDTESKLSITGGKLTFAGGKATPGYGDPGYWLGAVSRSNGRALGWLVNETTMPGNGLYVGWDINQAGTMDGYGIGFRATTILRINDNGALVQVGSSITTATDYLVAIVLRSTGAYYFMQGGAQFPNWTLLWISDTGAGATVYPCATNWNDVVTVDKVATPDDAIEVPLLAYDTFTRANGALGSTETTGPDGQVVATLPWTGATWAISTNAAVNTPTQGSEVVVNGGFDTDSDWTKGGGGWSIGSGVASHSSGADALPIYQTTSVEGTWYQGVFTLTSVIAGSATIRFGTWISVLRNAPGTFTVTGRSLTSSTVLGIAVNAATDVLSVDNVSVKALTLSTLFSSLEVSTADVVADVNVTGPTSTSGIQAGLVLNLDSASSPANFVLAYLDGKGNANLDKCVAGAYTNLVSAAVTYSAGAKLRVMKRGTSYWLFYNGAAVGTVQTVSDAGIVDNILHGVFSTSALNSLDTLRVYPTGTGGEHVALSNYFLA